MLLLSDVADAMIRMPLRHYCSAMPLAYAIDLSS